MEGTLARNWWAFVLRGALAIGFALMVVAWSSATPMALARVFGVFAMAEGALAIGSTLGARRDEDRPWPLVLEGSLGIGFGLVGLIAPFASLITVAWVIASWIAIVGMLEGATSLKMHRHVVTPRILVAVGVVSLAAAAAMVFAPFLGEALIEERVSVYLLGAWAAFLGVATLAIGLVMQRDGQTPMFDGRGGGGGHRTSVPSLVPVRASRPSVTGKRRGRR